MLTKKYILKTKIITGCGYHIHRAIIKHTMKLIADLHIHSFYSRATSKDLTFEYLYKWARIKGLNIVATGDIAHPGWLKEMKEKLDKIMFGKDLLKEGARIFKWIVLKQAEINKKIFIENLGEFINGS